MALEVTLKPFQDKFVFSKSKYPAMFSAWGTGKTLCLILRAMTYSRLIPNNLGVIFRKEYTDLRDSTVRDFENYTSIKVNSNRNVDLPNGSRVMFRHLEELNNIQNINLGWYAFEQGEELVTDKEFFLLWGRLRRALTPSKEFLDLGLPLHTGFVIGNVAGNNWCKQLWKNNPKKDFELIEATTFDNADVLPAEYLKGLEQLKLIKPDIYKRYVLNDWDVQREGKVFKANKVDACIGGAFEDYIAGEEYILGVDLAKYLDFTVLCVIKKSTRQVVYWERYQDTSWALNEARIIEVARKYHALVVPDSTGVGDPIVEVLQRAGLDIWQEETVDKAGFVFSNKSKEQLIENLIIAIEHAKVKFPNIEVLIDELKNYEVEITKSGNTRYGAPDGKHDDAVTSLALALYPIGRSEVGIFELG